MADPPGTRRTRAHRLPRRHRRVPEDRGVRGRRQGRARPARLA